MHIAPALKLKLVVAAIAALGLLATAPSCSSQQQQTAKEVTATIGSVAQEAPVACQFLSKLVSVSACGADAQAVSDVAKLVDDVLAALPPPAPGMTAAHPQGFASGMRSFTYRGVAVGPLPAAVAQQVWDRLHADAGAPSGW